SVAASSPPSARWNVRATTSYASRTCCARSSVRWPRSNGRPAAPKSTTGSRTVSARSTSASWRRDNAPGRRRPGPSASGSPALERAAAEVRDAEAQQRDAEARLEALAVEGSPLERTVEEAKDAVVEASAEESRLHNMGEALRRRHEELEGRRRKLEDEQRLLGERLRTNARDAEAAREAITRLEEERVGLGVEREALARRQLDLGREEA